MFGLDGLACHDNANVVAAAAFSSRSPLNSSSAAAKAVRSKIRLRITPNLTNAFGAKIAPQQVATDTMWHFYFQSRERDSGLADYRPRQPRSAGATYVT
jgi:hypothetical protein